MNQKIKDRSIDYFLRDTQHNAKAQEVFLKLLAKHKKPKYPFDEIRSITYPVKEIKPLLPKKNQYLINYSSRK